MGLIHKDTFVCLDCETTGLDPETDKIIEVAATAFTFENTFDSYETLVDPGCAISEASMAIHHITDEMVQGKPKIQEVLPPLLKVVDKCIVIGHGIQLDIAFLYKAAKQFQIPSVLPNLVTIDTLRLARLYGESPTNSLEKLREHFNIESEGAHRAMNDVIVNIEVFKHLASHFKTTEQLLERLKRPIALRVMPLGKQKAAPSQKFLLNICSGLRTKILTRISYFLSAPNSADGRKGTQFSQASNPFSSL